MSYSSRNIHFPIENSSSVTVMRFSHFANKLPLKQTVNICQFGVGKLEWILPGPPSRNIFRQWPIRLGYSVLQQHKDFHQWPRDERKFVFRSDSPLGTMNYFVDHNEILCQLLFYLLYHSYSENDHWFGNKGWAREEFRCWVSPGKVQRVDIWAALDNDFQTG